MMNIKGFRAEPSPFRGQKRQPCIPSAALSATHSKSPTPGDLVCPKQARCVVGQPRGWQRRRPSPPPVKRPSSRPLSHRPPVGPGSPAWHWPQSAILSCPPGHRAAPSPLRVGPCVPGLPRGRGRQTAPRHSKLWLPSPDEGSGWPA